MDAAFIQTNTVCTYVYAEWYEGGSVHTCSMIHVHIMHVYLRVGVRR